MSFKILDNPTFRHTVDIVVPSDGGYETQSLDVTCRVLDVETAKVFNLATADGVTDFLRKAVVSFDGVIDDGGRPVPYSDALRDRMLALPFVRKAIAEHYSDAVSRARLGN